MPDLDAVVHDAAELVVGPDENGDLEVIDGGAVAIANGSIVAFGETETIVREFPPENATEPIDASGKTVLPGFVDSHTHAVFAGDRSDEFALRLEGKAYQEILAEGGGILRTVRATREASEDTLVENLLSVLDTMLAHGATTVEVKSGYGLDRETELKQLRAIELADTRHPVDLIPTFLGAHAVPESMDRESYVTSVIEDQLPAVAGSDLAEYCDVFCDDGAFTRSEAADILQAGLEYELKPKIHAEEFEHLGGATLAAELEATSADHLLQATDDDARALANAEVVATLLPGTAFTLGVPYADPTQFQDAGATVAIASDFNPNCHSPSMVMTVQVAAHGMGMAPDAAIAAATAGGAAAVDRPEAGRIEVGTPGDIVIADVPTRDHIAYSFGINPVETVLKQGDRVHG